MIWQADWFIITLHLLFIKIITMHLLSDLQVSAEPLFYATHGAQKRTTLTFTEQTSDYTVVSIDKVIMNSACIHCHTQSVLMDCAFFLRTALQHYTILELATEINTLNDDAARRYIKKILM